MLSAPETAVARLPALRAASRGVPRLAVAPHVWELLALGATLLLATLLSLFQLDRQGYGNTYYAAAVKSMLTGWHAFFFASFDAGGFVSVDKPPVGLWVQAVSARLFGISGISLFLPQVLAGLASVGLLYHLVRRAFGPTAGLVASLALAVTPINAITNRNNTMDSQLVLVLLLAAWAASVAAERGKVGWLLAWGAYFSFARFYHQYSLVMLGPTVAALAGLGTAALWRAYRRGGWSALGLPLALSATGAAQVGILAAFPEWSRWLSAPIVVCCLSAAALVLLRRRPSPRPQVAAGAAALGVLALLVAPTVWAGIAIRDGEGGAWLPQAGPAQWFGRPGGPGGGPFADGQRPFNAASPTGGGGAGLPVEQPTRFELVLNLRTARALGLTFPSRSCCRRPR